MKIHFDQIIDPVLNDMMRPLRDHVYTQVALKVDRMVHSLINFRIRTQVIENVADFVTEEADQSLQERQ